MCARLKLDSLAVLLLSPLRSGEDGSLSLELGGDNGGYLASLDRWEECMASHVLQVVSRKFCLQLLVYLFVIPRNLGFM